MASRESITRRARELLLALVFILGWSGGAAANCAQLAARALNAFADIAMERVDVDDTVMNTCTRKRERATIEFKPGYGSVTIFLSGDVQGDIDPFVAALCEDGRAMLKNTVKSTVICDTR